MGVLRVIGRTPTVLAGDSVEEEKSISWSQDHPEQVAEAERVFKEYTVKGWLAIGEAGDRKVQIFRFNPELERITLSPINLGG